MTNVYKQTTVDIVTLIQIWPRYHRVAVDVKEKTEATVSTSTVNSEWIEGVDELRYVRKRLLRRLQIADGEKR